jgi:hypothetical protein
MVHQVEPDRKCQHHPNCLAQVVVFPLAWHKGGGGTQFDLRLCCKQDLKAERHSAFLCSLDQRGQDGGLFSRGHIKCDDEMGDRCSQREPDGSFLCLTVQFEYPHGSFENDIGILWCNSGEVTGECDASAA